jgi:hypothetical protein
LLRHAAAAPRATRACAFTIDDFALGLGALGDGFTIQTELRIRHPSVDRDDLPEGVGRDWSMFAVLVEAFVERLTEPVD